MAHTGTSRKPSRIVVRQAAMDDLDVIVELRLSLLREHDSSPIYAHVRADAPERARTLFAAQLRSLNEVTLLAEREGEVVGVLRCIDAAGLPLIDPLHYGYVSSVYVRPAVRRQGVLRALLAQAEEWARRRGLLELRLHSAAHNPLSNVSWDALGFETVEYLRMRPIR